MKQVRILLIEPDDVQQIAMRSALRTSGFRCSVAASPEAAAALPPEPYDLVFLGPSFADAEARTAAVVLQRHFAAPAVIIGLTALPDLMVGHELSGGTKIPPELPAALEALTRFLRFAPPRKPGPAEMDKLLGDWVEFDGKPSD